jgi:translation initiation factor 3 subunit F
MIHGQSGPAFDASVVFSTAEDERVKLTKSLEKLTKTIEQLSEYVEKVVNGKEEASMEIGMAISNAIDAVNQIRPSDFQANFQSRVQDLVMLSYINTLTQTQIAIADKLSAVL